MKEFIRQVNPEGLGWLIDMFGCYFVEPDLWSEIFLEKEDTTV